MEEEQDINGLIFRIRMPSLFAIVRTAFPVNLLRLFSFQAFLVLYISKHEKEHTLLGCAHCQWRCDFAMDLPNTLVTRSK